MIERRPAFVILLISACALVFTRGPQDPVPPASLELTPDERQIVFTLSPVPSIPPDTTNRYAQNDAAAHFGQFLFFDERLSGDSAISCATCHQPELAFTDGKSLAEGAAIGTRNTLSLLNVAHQRWFFWDGRADALWAQALSPLENPKEMAGSRLHVFRQLRDHPELLSAYEAIFGAFPNLPENENLPVHARPVPDDTSHPHHAAWVQLTPPIQAAVNSVFVNVGKVLAAYEHQLQTGPSAFDQFVQRLRQGNGFLSDEFGAEELRGLKLFVGKANCRLCHNGPLLTDLEFHNVGVPGRAGLPADAGRYRGIGLLRKAAFGAGAQGSDDPECDAAKRTNTLIHSPESWGQFRTPSLRNVERTAPYMHQGQFADLRSVIEHYSTLENAAGLGHHQEQVLIPLNLTDQEIHDLLAFLRSLTGQPLAPALLRRPENASLPVK